MINLIIPVSESTIRSLKVGDEVLISGNLFTGRDVVHKYLHEGGQLPPKVKFKDAILYHCGPVVMKDEQGNWKVTAAGPTTSIREEPYQWQVIRDFGLRGVIGKGGMGEKTVQACKDYGCVYLHAIGGAGLVVAECVKKVPRGHFLKEFGPPGASWGVQGRNFAPLYT